MLQLRNRILYLFGPPLTDRSSVYEQYDILNDLLMRYKIGVKAATGAETWDATDVCDKLIFPSPKVPPLADMSSLIPTQNNGASSEGPAMITFLQPPYIRAIGSPSAVPDDVDDSRP